MAELDLATHRFPLPWQLSTWESLSRRRAAGTLPHALLLAGPPGVGKQRFAQALSLALLCQQPDLSGIACGECRACHFAASGSHPDWRWLAPEDVGKAIKIDQIREAGEFVAQTAQLSGRQVVVLTPVESLNRFAANALLKTLEEPAGEAVLILITDAPGQLLPTLRSRCQRLDFPVPPVAQSLDWLQALAGDRQAAEELLHEADDRPVAARSLLEEGALTARQERSRLLAQLVNGELSALALAQRWKDDELAGLLGWLLARLMAAARVGLASSATDDPAVRGLALMAPHDLFDVIEAVQVLLAQQRAGSNPNRQLALEALLLRMVALLPSGARRA